MHLLTWFKAGIRSGKTREESIELALSHCAPAMWQTSAIVAIGLLMLAPASLLMISRFGILMAALIGSALIADIIFLPALLTGVLGYVIERTERKNIRKGNDESTGSRPEEKSDAADEIVEHATLEPTEANGSENSSNSSSISGPHHSAKSGSRQSEIEAR
ncbi:MMPL family transporter [bacterium]|nr:MMPL family transporter [bacterium]